MSFEPVSPETEYIAPQIVDGAFKVHKALGPGLLESVYAACLCHELSQRNLSFKTEVPVPVIYNNVRLDAGLRLDLLVADSVIVELKSVEKMNSLFAAQLLTYLKTDWLATGITY